MSMMKKLLMVIAVLALVAAPVDARSHKRKRGSEATNTPGQFDYYLLTLSWAPDFCDSHPQQANNRECGRGNHVGFIVHGLWPQFEAGGYPKQCGSSSPVATEIVNRMLPVMMDAGLVQHEWRDHGVCTGLDTAAYFDRVRQAYAQVKVPDDLKNLSAPLSITPGELDAKFIAANPSLNSSVHTECGGDEVSEVRICLSKDLKPRACGAGVQDCSAGKLRMLPPR